MKEEFNTYNTDLFEAKKVKIKAEKLLIHNYHFGVHVFDCSKLFNNLN